MTSSPVAEAARQEKQVSRVLGEADASLDTPDENHLEPSVYADRMRTFASTNLSRMKTEWGDDEQIVIEEIKAIARRAIEAEFKVAFDQIEEIYNRVRKPVVDRTTGAVLTSSSGRPLWEPDDAGNPAEDWSMLSDRHRDNFLYSVAIHLFDWELKAVDMWAESMYAKGMWEEVFAKAFMAPKGRLTVDDRTQHGHSASMEQRYLAIYRAVLSKQADAVIRSMVRIQGVLERTTRRL